MNTIWVLVTGSRDVVNREWVYAKAHSLITDLKERFGDIRLIHGDASGVDEIFHKVARDYRGITVEPWPARLFPTPLIRNKFMVNLVRRALDVYPDDEAVVWAFARRWASGTGHCAREARRQGLTVIDYGVSTEERSS